ncbi:hypothetical protein GCM10023178_21350 [Actinomadura luteofluorescens]
MPPVEFVLIGGLAALVGAIVQGSVGLGVGLVATPIVTMLFPSLMPGAILVIALALPFATLAQEVRHADLRGLAAAAQDLRAYLADGGALKRGPLRSGAQRQAEPLLATVKVDGAAPTTPELLDIVNTDLMVRITCRELQYVWEAAGISFPADLPPGERVARFVRAHARLARVRDAMTALDSTRRLLERSGFRVPLAHPIQWHDYAAALRNALEGLGVSRAKSEAKRS